MGKLISLLAAGAGATAATVGGVYILRRSTSSPKDFISPELPFADLAGFKRAKGDECTQRYFGKLDYENSKGTAISSTNTFNSTDFLGTSAEGTIPKSCLVINWEKTDAADTVADANKK